MGTVATISLILGVLNAAGLAVINTDKLKDLYSKWKAKRAAKSGAKPHA